MSETTTAIKERQRLEFLIKRVWPTYRLFVKHHLTKRCTKCAISERASGTFSPDGICPICLQKSSKTTSNTVAISEEQEAAMHAQIANALSGAQGTGGFLYDALVFYSGGKDSTYLLHRLKIDYPNLRLLAITVDNGFMSPVAMSNIKQTIARLDVEHMILKPPSTLYKKLFAYAFTHPSKMGSAESIDVLDGELRFDIGRHLAAKLHIPLILIGLSRDQMSVYNGKPQCESDRAFEESKRTTVSNYTLTELPLSSEESKYWWDATRYDNGAIARVLFPLAAWNKDEQFLSNEVVALGLISEGKQSPLLTNHLLIPLMALTDVAQLGYASWEPEFAQMIREGKADRKYWQHLFEMVEYAAKTGRFIGASIDDLLTQLNLRRADVGL